MENKDHDDDDDDDDAGHNDMLQGGCVLQYIMTCYKVALCCSA